MSRELDAAILAARAAGRLQRRRFGRQKGFELKSDDTPVTATDRDSQAIIRRTLEAATPAFGFLSEEDPDAARLAALGPGRGVSRWIVDPLDGTKKFVRGMPFFGPSIALEQDGELCLGVLYLPALGEMLWAERGSGAFLNDKPVRVSVEARVARGFVIVGNEAEFFARGWAASFGDLHGRLYHNPGFLDLYSYATLASGRVDAVVMVGEAPWDVAAARVIVEEAGGRFTDFRGESTVYGGTTIASNGHLHDELLELLGTCR